jgi:excisionase family DNA binding protein
METLYTRVEAAAALRVSVDTFDERIAPHLPYTLVGRRRRYSPEDLEKWLASQKVGSSVASTKMPRGKSASPSLAGGTRSALAKEIEARLLSSRQKSTPRRSTAA